MNKLQFREIHDAEDTSSKAIEYALNGRSENEFFDVKFKAPRDDLGWAEIVRDVIAFYNNKGGYIIFGIDDDFNLVGDNYCNQLDSKLVNDKISKYTGQIRVKFASHEIERKIYGVLFIPSKIDGRAAAWAEKDSPAKSDGSLVFRRRDIFLRIGDECKIQDHISKISDMYSLVNETRSSIKYVRESMSKLIQPDYDRFIGRDEFKEKILHLLSPDHISLVVNIGGVGGVGKSALATWATHQIFGLKQYDVIVSISAKDKELSTKGIVQLERKFFTYDDLLREIADTYEYQYELNATTEQLEQAVLELLDIGNCLLFIDNYETIEDNRIEYFLQNKFVTKRYQRHKALITSRTSVVPGEYPLKLPEFRNAELDSLLVEFSHTMMEPRLASLNEKVKSKLFEQSGGLPLGLKYVTASFINLGLPADYGLDANVNKTNLDQMLIYCFKGMFKTFDSQTQNLLMTLAIFNEPIDFQSLASAANLSEINLKDAITPLINAMLVKKDINSLTAEEKYSILPITKKFAIAEMGTNIQYRNLEVEIKKRVAEHNRKISIAQRQSKNMRESYPEYKNFTDNQKIALGLLDEAFESKSLNRIETARYKFERSTRSDSSFAIPFYEWALFEWEQGNIGNADALFKSALSSSLPKKMRKRVLMSWSTMLSKVDNFKSAAEKVGLALKDDPTDIIMRHQHAYYLSRAGFYGRAEQLFKQLLDDLSASEVRQKVITQHARIQNFIKMDDKDSARAVYDLMSESDTSSDKFLGIRRILGK